MSRGLLLRKPRPCMQHLRLVMSVRVFFTSKLPYYIFLAQQVAQGGQGGSPTQPKVASHFLKVPGFLKSQSAQMASGRTILHLIFLNGENPRTLCSGEFVPFLPKQTGSSAARFYRLRIPLTVNVNTVTCCCVNCPRGVYVQLVTKTKKMFVGGLSASTTIEDVRSYFEQFGKVSRCFHTAEPSLNVTQGALPLTQRLGTILRLIAEFVDLPSPRNCQRWPSLHDSETPLTDSYRRVFDKISLPRQTSHADFKFEAHVSRDSSDMNPSKFFEKGASVKIHLAEICTLNSAF